MKTFSVFLLTVAMGCIAQSATLDERHFQQSPDSFSAADSQSTAPPDRVAPDSSGMGTSTSVELSKELTPGWNLGNTLEAMPTETSWGNPKASQQLIDSIKAAGFRSVRIPVAWSSHFTADTSGYVIDSTWLARVAAVVGYVLRDSMYAIINEHWDGGWQQPTYADSAYVNNRLALMWKQIALYFRDYDSRLLFAGTNEVMVTNDYSTPRAEYYTVQNSFNRTFVNAVRATGGRNYYRYLLVQGFNTNIDYATSFLSVPQDVVPERLFVEVHYYDPYDFTINETSKITEWGKYATNPSKTETWANESYADGQFLKMQTKFIDKGYGVILGEYGVMARLDLGSADLNAQYESFRRYYMQYVTRSMERHGLVPVYWDNGGTGNHGMGLFNRSTGAQVYPGIVDAVVDTSRVDPVTGVEQTSPGPTGFNLGQNYPNPFNPTTTIGYRLSVKGHVTLNVFDALGRKVAALVDRDQNAGSHAVEFDGAGFPSGVYFYRLTEPGSEKIGKMMMIK